MKAKLFLLILLLGSFLSNSQQFTPFNWQYPLYGGHSLNNIKYINDQNFIAVGDAGTILKSSDDGVTWSRTEPFTEVDFKGIHIIDSATYFIVGSTFNGDGEIYKTIDAGVTWELVFENIQMSLKDIHFANDSVGYCVGNTGRIVKTVDFGQTWTDITNNGNLSGTLNAVWFINADFGFVCRSNFPASMYKTENGGLTWSQVFGYTSSGCYSIHMLNDTLGYAGGNSSRIFRTTNGGQTWSQQTNFNTSQPVRSIAFADSIRGIAVTNSYIYRTVNGTTWFSPYYGNNHFGGAISPSGTAIVGNDFGGIKRSIDGGSNFLEQNPQAGNSTYRRVKFLDAQNGWVAGDGNSVLKTSDGGLNWVNTNTSNFIDYMNDMAAISSNKLIMVTGNQAGKVVTTTNGGNTFTEQTLSATNSLNAISFPTSSIGYVVGDNGVAFKTTNGGTSYTSINTGITNNIKKVFFTSAQIGFVVSEVGQIKKTNNGGSSWTDLPTSGMGTTKQIYFTNELNGYTINELGNVFRTADGGATFTAAGETCLQVPFDLQFINDSTGFSVGDNVNATCEIILTTNYGASWQAIKLPYAYALVGVSALDTANIYVVGQNRSIIKIGDGEIITSQKQINEVNFTLFPNPTNGIVTISLDNLGVHSYFNDAKIECFDISGKLVFNTNATFPNTQLDFSFLDNGVYLISVAGHHKNIKVVKQ